MKRSAVFLLVLVAYLLVAQPVSAYYIPKEYQAEAQPLAKGGNPGLYPFFLKHWTDGQLKGWAYDGLRQMAMQETNSGKIADLHVVMKVKYGK